MWFKYHLIHIIFETRGLKLYDVDYMWIICGSLYADAWRLILHGHIQIDTVHGNESSTSEAMMERCAIDSTANS
jgi:hypothetical protein